MALLPQFRHFQGGQQGHPATPVAEAEDGGPLQVVAQVRAGACG
ncbi:MAG: hypothetical protein ACO1SX_20665 [Actinomycetota bacterium]